MRRECRGWPGVPEKIRGNGWKGAALWGQVSIPERQVLLEHVGFLRAIALGVLRNEADADDAVQQTLATALQKPPADDSNLRGWLATVVRNFARMQLRSRSRRRAREESVAKREGAPSTARIAQRMEMERHVVDAIASLDEPFRTTLILRFYDDLQPKEIAARMGVPAATVRTRLKRGLDKLRAQLEEKNGGNRKATFAGLLLLAQLPARATPLRWLPVASVATIVIGVVSIAVMIADLAEGPGEPSQRTPVVDRAPEFDGEDALDSDATAIACVISGRILDERGGAPDGAEVIAYPHAGAGLLDTPITRWQRWMEQPKPLARAAADKRGAYTIRVDPPRPVWLVYRAPGFAVEIVPLPDASGSYGSVDVELRKGRARGVLIDARTDLPIADATIHAWGSEFTPFGAPGLITARTDEDGEFTLPFAAVRNDDGKEKPNRVSLVIDARNSGIAPRVFLSRPTTSLDLEIAGFEPLSIRTEPGACVMAVASRAIDVAVADDKGVARFAEFPDAIGSLIVTHPEHVARHERTRLTGAREIDMPLQRGKLVRGTVLHAGSGKPVAGAFVGVVPGSNAQATLFDTLVATRTDREGRFELRLRAGQGRQVAIAHPSLGTVRRARRRSVISLAADRQVRGSVVLDPSRAPIPGARVWIESRGWLSAWAGDQRRLRTAITRADGTYEIHGAPVLDGIKIAAHHPRYGTGILRCNPGKHEYDFALLEQEPRVRRNRDPIVELRGVVVDAAGVKLREVTVRAIGAVDEWTTTTADGSFALRVRGQFPQTITLRRGKVIREVEYAGPDHFAELTMPSGPAVSGRVVHAGKPIGKALVRSLVDGKTRDSVRTGADGRFVLWRWLAEGPDEIVIEAAGYETARLTPPLTAETELHPASTLVVKVVAENGEPLSQLELRLGERRLATDINGVIRLYKTQKSRPEFVVVPGGPGWILLGEPQWSKDGRMLKLVVRRGERIEGRVVDSENRGVPHILVLAVPTAEGRATRRAFTNSKGYFVLRGLHPERYQLRVGESKQGVEIEAGTRELVLRKESR